MKGNICLSTEAAAEKLSICDWALSALQWAINLMYASN